MNELRRAILIYNQQQAPFKAWQTFPILVAGPRPHKRSFPTKAGTAAKVPNLGRQPSQSSCPAKRSDFQRHAMPQIWNSSTTSVSDSGTALTAARVPVVVVAKAIHPVSPLAPLCLRRRRQRLAQEGCEQ